jgi:type II secretory pathway component PulF
MQYQAICSKANKKLTISLTANNIDEARSILHGQGYSIMEIKELEYSQTENNKGNFFYFDIRVN